MTGAHLFSASTLPPSSMSAVTAARWPEAGAACRGVNRSLSRAFTWGEKVRRAQGVRAGELRSHEVRADW